MIRPIPPEAAPPAGLPRGRRRVRGGLGSPRRPARWVAILAGIATIVARGRHLHPGRRGHRRGRPGRLPRRRAPAATPDPFPRHGRQRRHRRRLHRPGHHHRDGSPAWWPFTIILLVAIFGYLFGLSTYGTRRRSGRGRDRRRPGPFPVG